MRAASPQAISRCLKARTNARSHQMAAKPRAFPVEQAGSSLDRSIEAFEKTTNLLITRQLSHSL
jgi:hypothetical protein